MDESRDYEEVKTYYHFIFKFYLQKIKIRSGGWKEFKSGL